MKYISLVSLIAVLMVVSIPRNATAQAGIYWPASVLEEEQLVVGTDILLGSLPTFGWIAHARYGLNGKVDIAPKIGFARESGTTLFAMGGDVRYGIMQEEWGDDFDVNVTAAMNVWTGSGWTLLTVGVGPQFGRTVPMEGSDFVLSPYAGIMLGMSRASANNNSNTDFGGILPIGNQIIINDNLAAHFELDVMFGADTELQVGLGIHYLY